MWDIYSKAGQQISIHCIMGLVIYTCDTSAQDPSQQLLNGREDLLRTFVQFLWRHVTNVLAERAKS
jgi:hypothetical protein